jgi:hypothetical protein
VLPWPPWASSAHLVDTTMHAHLFYIRYNTQM